MITYNEKNGLTVTIKLDGDGSRLLMIQKALILAIDEISQSERNDGENDFKEAVWNLCELQREFMLDEDQLQVGIGGKPFKQSLSA